MLVTIGNFLLHDNTFLFHEVTVKQPVEKGKKGYIPAAR